jgi:hypothetical protein
MKKLAALNLIETQSVSDSDDSSRSSSNSSTQKSSTQKSSITMTKISSTPISTALNSQSSNLLSNRPGYLKSTTSFDSKSVNGKLSRSSSFEQDKQTAVLVCMIKDNTYHVVTKDMIQSESADLKNECKYLAQVNGKKSGVWIKHVGEFDEFLEFMELFNQMSLEPPSNTATTEPQPHSSPKTPANNKSMPRASSTAAPPQTKSATSPQGSNSQTKSSAQRAAISPAVSTVSGAHEQRREIANQSVHVDYKVEFEKLKLLHTQFETELRVTKELLAIVSNERDSLLDQVNDLRDLYAANDVILKGKRFCSLFMSVFSTPEDVNNIRFHCGQVNQDKAFVHSSFPGVYAPASVLCINEHGCGLKAVSSGIRKLVTQLIAKELMAFDWEEEKYKYKYQLDAAYTRINDIYRLTLPIPERIMFYSRDTFDSVVNQMSYEAMNKKVFIFFLSLQLMLRFMD